LDPTTRTDVSRKRLGSGWRIFARIFTAINVLGFVYAVSMSEPLHAAAHLAIQLVGITYYLVWRFSSRAAAPHLPPPDPTSALIARLQESVDKIALDVERVGESQRFQTKLLEKEVTTPQ
jgi:hypothetical protein